MKYPYISTTLNNLIFYAKDRAILIGDESNQHSHGFNIKADESKFENNTTEYLANTYGEVKSKAHAEFIVKLAEVNGFDFDGEVGINSNYFCFFPSNCKQLTFWRKEKDASKHGSRKQITIPLPPECEERKPKEVIANNKKHTLNLVTGFYDFVVIELGYATGSTLEKLQEADDYQALSFVDECDEGKEDEWPKVNDEVVLDDDVGIVKLPADAQDYYIVEVNGLYKQCRFGELSKPKTPEQELRDEVNDCINDFQCQYMEREDIDYDKLAEYILSRFDINKKPQ